jgi:Mg-chelatase subunit ChlD
VTLEELIPGVTPAPEKEPNDESPQPLKVGEWVRGKLPSAKDRDLYKFKVSHDRTQIPFIELHVVPFLRTNARILDLKGNEVLKIDPAKTGGTSAREVLQLDPGEYLLELTSTPVYVFLGFDTSGSMSGTFKTTAEALTAWADKLPEGFKIALGSSMHSKKWGAFTLRLPFSDQAEGIKKTAKTMFEDDGDSDWYTVLKDMVAYADESIPKDTSGAVVFMADGNGSGRFFEMWDVLFRSRMRLYTIGFGDVGRSLDSTTSWDGQRGLFNVAWYRGGRYMEPHTAEDLVKVYEAIFNDLSSPPEYAVRVGIRERRPGQVVSEAPQGEKRPLLFILDCSGSMMQLVDEESRFAIAKKVVGEIVRTLPDKAEVGLRAYGHRFRTIDREKAMTDSELLIPIGELDREAFMAKVNRLRARGGTPLAHSLKEAQGDISGWKRPKVVLITDGVEGFRGKPVQAARELRASAKEMDFAVVGFAIEEEFDQDNLSRMAESGKGVYYNAEDAATLIGSIREALSPTVPYVILALDGREVATGKLGDTHELLEGRYTAVFRIEGKEKRVEIRVRPGGVTRLK